MKVIQRFKDKETGRIYSVGESFDGTPARVKELQKLKFLEKPKPKKESDQE